jgi:uncharacterized membrane protein
MQNSINPTNATPNDTPSSLVTVINPNPTNPGAKTVESSDVRELLENENHAPQQNTAGSTRKEIELHWWIVNALLALPALLVILTLIFYGTKFPKPWAERQDVWGQFGDFFGGVLNPIIGWINLVVIALTFRYTVRTLQVSVDSVKVAQDQANVAQQHLNLVIEHENARRNEETQAQRKQQTFQLYQTWVSPEMQVLRTRIWDFLNTGLYASDCSVLSRNPEVLDGNPTIQTSDASSNDDQLNAPLEINEAQRTLFLGSYRTSSFQRERNCYYSVGSISHFIADANAMLNAEILDHQLFNSLLGRSLSQWCELYKRLDFRRHENDRDPSSINENEWHRKAVEGLSTYLLEVKDIHL